MNAPTATTAPAPDAGAPATLPAVSFVTPAPADLVRWAIEHYARLLDPETTFPAARARFAERVLLRDDKTVRRWLAGQTEVDPRVLNFLSSKWREAGYGPRRYRRALRTLTTRELLWER